MYCYNKETAAAYGVDLPSLPFDTITMVDSVGRERHFNVSTQVVPRYIIVNATESTKNGQPGYEFATRASHKTDIHTVCEKLIKKMERELNKQYVSEHVVEGHRLLGLNGDLIKGRLEFDEDSLDDSPLVVVDGHPYNWSEFGRILRQFEGFQFKMKISDITDD